MNKELSSIYNIHSVKVSIIYALIFSIEFTLNENLLRTFCFILRKEKKNNSYTVNELIIS